MTRHLNYRELGIQNAADTGAARILIVDDDEMERMIGRSILQDAGHQLLFATNGEVALKVFDTEPIDIVITDLAMPNLNGLRLIQELRERDRTVKIIAVSGVNAEQLDMAERYGAAKTLVKPVTPELLLATVNELLQGLYVPPPDDLWE